MNYDSAVVVSQITALFLFITLFIGVLIYTFWPSNRAKFDRAASLPLAKDPDDLVGGGRNGR